MDFTKTCWYCGRNTVEPEDGFYACSSCGATWTDVPKLGVEAIVVETVVPGVTSARPSKRLVRGIGKKIKKEKKDAV